MSASGALDALSVEQCLRVINTQDMEVPQVVRAAIPALTRFVDTVVAHLALGGRLIYAGAGTSGRLGVLDASECPPTFQCDPGEIVGLIAGGDGALRRSSEGREDDPAGPAEEFAALGVNNRDVVLGIAAGGTTPWVWGALQRANEVGAATGMLCCVRRDMILQRAKAPVVQATASVAAAPRPAFPAVVEHWIELPVGAEVVTGSTRMKAGTATKLALNMITTATMVQRGKVWGNLMVDLRASNTKLRDRAARILMQQLGLDRASALELLDAADGQVKTALVMHRRQVSRAAALALLAENAGKLRPLLGSPR